MVSQKPPYMQAILDDREVCARLTASSVAAISMKKISMCRPDLLLHKNLYLCNAW